MFEDNRWVFSNVRFPKTNYLISMTESYLLFQGIVLANLFDFLIVIFLVGVSMPKIAVHFYD